MFPIYKPYRISERVRVIAQGAFLSKAGRVIAQGAGRPLLCRKHDLLCHAR